VVIRTWGFFSLREFCKTGRESIELNMPTLSTSRIREKFRQLREAQAKGLVIYVTAGDPSLEATGDLLAAIQAGGADIIELGIPFSDPLADGPVIQRASERALPAEQHSAKCCRRSRNGRKHVHCRLCSSAITTRSCNTAWKTLRETQVRPAQTACSLSISPLKNQGTILKREKMEPGHHFPCRAHVN